MLGRFKSGIIFVLFCFNIVSFGANKYFVNSIGNNLWRTSGNWTAGIPASADQAVFDSAVTCLIDSSTSAQCTNLYFAHTGGGNTLNITGGTLTIPYNFYLQVYYSTTGTVNISGGVVSADHLAIATQGTGILNMTGGTINIGSKLWVPFGNNGIAQGEHAEIHLNGGVINCANFHMHAGGSLDITLGTLIINGDVTSDIFTYKNNGWITAYGSSGIVKCDYNLTTPGKTTVTGFIQPSSASNPNPGNETEVDSAQITLSWDPGYGAIYHNIYIGTDPNDVNEAAPNFLLGDLDENGQIDISDIVILCDAWLQSPIGQQPSPDINGDNIVNLKDYAISALNWLGQSEYKGAQTENTYGPLTYETGRTYWWRIDEIDSEPTITKGPLWSFKITDSLSNQVNLASQWRFKTDPTNAGVSNLWHTTGYNDSTWDLLNVPEAWESQGYPSYDGYAWYRKWVHIPAEWGGSDCQLVFGGVDDEYDVYVNGQYVVHHGGVGQSVWNKTTLTEISAYTTAGTDNLIAIRVNDWSGGGGIVSAPTAVGIGINLNDYLSLDEFFARGDLTPEEQSLKAVIYHSPTYNPVFRAPDGFVSPPRIIGFVANNSYCQQYASVLRNNVNHSNTQVRYAVAERLAELKDAEGFEVLLDALKAETNATARGIDKWLFEYPGIADRLIAMIGHPDGYDPAGTKKLRDAVIEKWRSRWLTEGDTWLRGLKKAQNYSPVAGTQKLELQGVTVATRSTPDMEEFFLLGSSNIYEFAAMDGRFPPAGFLLGDDAGIWSHPVKAMDGFEFTIKEIGYADWKLLDCTNFVQKLHSVGFNFSQNGLSAKRTDFAVENDSALFTVLTLTNDTTQARTVNVEFTGRVNIRPAFQSYWTNDLDIVSYDAGSGVIQAYDSTYTQFATVFGSNQTPSSANVADNVGTLTYAINVPSSGSTDIAFLIVAEKLSGTNNAKQRFNTMVGQRAAIQTARENAYQQKLFNDVAFSCSNADVTNAFACAKANMMMMTIDARPWQVGPYFNGGAPEYSGLFGCDTEYAIAGACAGGFSDTAKTNLQCLAHFAQTLNGRVPHLVATSGNTIVASGNSQESQQFIAACGDYFEWTGDVNFINDYYSQMKQSINYVLNNIDVDGDHYPEGPSIMEVAGVTGENIDSACYLYKAFDVMAKFADYLGYTSDAATYTNYASNLKNNFNSNFWNTGVGMWADALNPSQQMVGLWGVCIPQEIEIADPTKAQLALNKIESYWVNTWNLYGSPNPVFITSPYTNGVLANGAYNYGKYQIGWNRIKLTTKCAMELGMLGGFENVAPKTDDVPLIESPAFFIQNIVEGLCGIRPKAVNHSLEIFPQPPAELDDLSLNNFYVGQHKLDFSWIRESGGDQEMIILHESGPVAINVTLRVRSEAGQTIKLNGTTINPSEETVRGIVTKPVTVTLAPGQQAVVRVE